MPNTLVSDENKDKFLSGDQLRDRTWRLLNASSGDFAPKYIGTAFNPKTAGQPKPNTDGLIRTPNGYYRLAEDIRDGTRVLLHSYEREQLVGARQKDGSLKLPKLEEKDYDVYGVTARQNVDGSIFRDDMTQDMRYLHDIFSRDMNLHSEEIRKGAGTDEQSHIVKFVNGKFGLALFEKDDGTWIVREYSNLRSKWDEASQFVNVDTKAPGHFWNRWLSLGKDIREFDNYKDAFEYVRRYNNTASRLRFKGKPLNDGPKTFKGKVVREVMDFFEQKKYRDWGIATAVGVVIGTVSAIVSGVPLIGAMAGIGVTARWVLSGKAIENTLYNMWKRKAEANDKKAIERLKPHTQKNLIENYLKPGPDNANRARQKIDSEAIEHLRLLNHDESQMNYDDGSFAPIDNPNRDLESLTSAANRYFGAVFDTTHADRGLLTAIYPNGLISITQVDVKTRATRSYQTYRNDFNLIAKDNQAGKHLDPGLTSLPSDGPVHKITHYQGRDFRYVATDERGLIADLMHRIGDDAKDFRAFGMPLTELFNISDAQNITAKPAHGAPIHQTSSGNIYQPEKSTPATKATL